MRNCLAILGVAVVLSFVMAPAGHAAPSPMPPADALPHEALRMQLAEWVPPYHALVAEGQLVGTTPASPLPEAVVRVWQEVAHSTCQSARQSQERAGHVTPVVGLFSAWQQRLCTTMTALAASPNFASVLARTQATRAAAQHLAEELSAAWALAHNDDIARSLRRHLADAQQLEQALAAAPMPVGHNLEAMVVGVGQVAELRLSWTPPGDAKGAPAEVRLYLERKPSSPSAWTSGDAGASPGQKQLLAELPRATASAKHKLEAIEFGLHVVLVPVSAFGIEGPATSREVTLGWPTLMPVTHVSATPSAPLLEQRDFYRNLDAVAVQWACSPSEHAAPGSAQLLRYDVYRAQTHAFAAAVGREAQPSFAAPFDVFSHLGPWGELPAEREYVGSTDAHVCTLTDRPGAERLREGVAYVVAAVGLQEQRAVAPLSDEVAPQVRHDVAPLLALARAGGDRLVHPTHFEREQMRKLSGDALRERRRIFGALPKDVQTRELTHFWRAYPLSEKRKWRDSYETLLTDEERATLLDVALTRLPQHLVDWASLNAFVAEHEDVRGQVAEHWQLLPPNERREVSLAWSRARRHEPLLSASTSAEPPHGMAFERVFAWARARDVEDEAQAQAWWTAQSAEAQHATLSTWARSLTPSGQRDLACPSFAALGSEARTSYLNEPPSLWPEALWPAFFAWQDYVLLSEADKLALIEREVAWPRRAAARLRYAVRPLDIWLAFERASAIATWGLGMSLGWYAYSFVSPGRRRRRRGITSESQR